MLIQVVFADKKIGILSQSDLNRQIDNGSVAAFRRLDGWVVVGRDPVRNGTRPYWGEERRKTAGRSRRGVATENDRLLAVCSDKI